jgi:DNA polymerase-3 subunit delta
MIKQNLFLLLGPEEGEKREFIKAYLQRKTKDLGEKPEILRFYAFESRILDIVSTLQNQSLFSRFTVLILYNVETIKKVDDQKILADYLQHPSECAALFLVSPGIHEVSKVITKHIPESQKKIFWELAENRKRNWIQEFFRTRSITIEPSALEFLLEMLENNTRDLKNTCNRLALFFGPDAKIKGEDLEKYVYHSKEENVFTLFERIAQRDLPAAMEVLHKMLLSGEADGIKLINGLLWQIRKLLSFKLLLKKNFHQGEIFRKLKIWSKKNQHIYTLAHRNFAFAEIEAIIVLVTDFDVSFRSVKTEMQILLCQLLLYYIIKKGGRRMKGKDILFH